MLTRICLRQEFKNELWRTKVMDDLFRDLGQRSILALLRKEIEGNLLLRNVI